MKISINGSDVSRLLHPPQLRLADCRVTLTLPDSLSNDYLSPYQFDKESLALNLEFAPKTPGNVN